LAPDFRKAFEGCDLLDKTVAGDCVARLAKVLDGFDWHVALCVLDCWQFNSTFWTRIYYEKHVQIACR
jgi:hypothetical protein